MKPTGIVRKVDHLGRVCIPVELRRLFEIEVHSQIEIETEGEMIILSKDQSDMACHVTGEVSNQNIQLAAGNIILSPEGAQQLIQEIQQHNLNAK